MSEEFEIKNKVADSGLVNFDLSELVPKGTRKGIDLKDFLWEGMILREKDFRDKVAAINPEDYRECYVYIIILRMQLCRFGLIFSLPQKLPTKQKK